MRQKPTGDELAKRRRRARLTQRDLALALGCSISSISDFENGDPLPWLLTPDDYLAIVVTAEAQRAKVGAK